MAAVAALMIVPSMSFAADRHERAQRNQWNDIAVGAGALGVLGLISGNNTLATVGLVGAGYSAYRADQVPVYRRYDDHYYRGDYRFNKGWR